MARNINIAPRDPLTQYRSVINPPQGVSWPTICYMLGEVQYGGRVTDDFDKRLLVTFTHVWFSERLVRPNFAFYEEYRVPPGRTLPQYQEYIGGLPDADTPQLFGLHANADITSVGEGEGGTAWMETALHCTEYRIRWHDSG